MKVEFNESFLKDLKTVKDKSVLAKLKIAIEAAEQSDSLDKIVHLKKMRGSREYFRIRVGDFRIGVKLEGNTLVLSDSSTEKTSIDISRDLSAVAMTKRLLYDIDVHNITDAIEQGIVTNAKARMTEDCQQGIAKFLEK